MMLFYTTAIARRLQANLFSGFKYYDNSKHSRPRIP